LLKGEKTYLFWAGLLIMSLASVILFSVIWSLRNYSSSLPYAYNYYSYLDSSVPVIVGSTVFVLVGLYMMKSGVKKETPSTQK